MIRCAQTHTHSYICVEIYQSGLKDKMEDRKLITTYQIRHQEKQHKHETD